MPGFERIIEKAQARPGRIVLPEGDDPRVLQAAVRALASGIAKPVLLGSEQTINRLADDEGVSLAGIDIIDPATSEHLNTLTDALVARRAKRGMTPEKAAEAILDPLHFACMMVHENLADGCVAGAVYPTANVVRSAMQLVGKHSDYSFVSSFFMMLMSEDFHPRDDVMFFSDCALVIDPDEHEMAEIAVVTGQSAVSLLGVDPEIAMLSFSTAGSASHSTVSKVQKATAIAREKRPDWRIIGEVQLDAAVIPPILAKKSPEQATDNPANILIFPSLDAGNIGYKMCERFGNVEAIGPVLQGLSKPVNDLSRGCKTDDIYNIIAVTSNQV